jgi:hypothetical protein
MAKTEEPELTTPFKQRATPQPRHDPHEPGSAALNSSSTSHSSAARPSDSIRLMIATGEPPAPDAIATQLHGRPHFHHLQSEAFAARAADVTGSRSAAIAMNQDQAAASDARWVHQTVPPIAKALDIRQPTRDQNLASRLRAEEPEVQVHIGRVEVIAVQPPAPTPRREKATRLADYLTARNGSGR